MGYPVVIATPVYHFTPADEEHARPMARSMWRGDIQFGLVTIPVKLYLAKRLDVYWGTVKLV